MKKTLFILSIAFVFNTKAQIITTIAGNGTYGFSGDGGNATTAELANAPGVAVDATGNLYIADYLNERIRKVTPTGIISTYAGNGTASFSGDGGQATAAFLHEPNAVAVDATGNLYIADYYNQVIRMVNTAGIISTFAGNRYGNGGYSGDGGQATAAELYEPAGVACDAAGNVYVADMGNYVIRKINSSGIISTFAGNGTAGYVGDGGNALAAELGPQGVACDAVGNLYIADEGNQVIRMVTASTGIINTVAGNGTGGFSGDGGNATAAELEFPSGVAVDATGNIYICDQYNSRIRKVNTAGIISTFAGNAINGFYGNGVNATAAELNYPKGVACDAAGNVYIADMGNQRIRMVNNPSNSGIEQFETSNNAVKIAPNPFTDNTTISIEPSTTPLTFLMYDMLGKEVQRTENITTSEIQIQRNSLQSGMYFFKIMNNGSVLNTGKVIIE